MIKEEGLKEFLFYRKGLEDSEYHLHDTQFTSWVHARDVAEELSRKSRSDIYFSDDPEGKFSVALYCPDSDFEKACERLDLVKRTLD